MYYQMYCHAYLMIPVSTIAMQSVMLCRLAQHTSRHYRPDEDKHMQIKKLLRHTSRTVVESATLNLV